MNSLFRPVASSLSTCMLLNPLWPIHLEQTVQYLKQEARWTTSTVLYSTASQFDSVGSCDACSLKRVAARPSHCVFIALHHSYHPPTMLNYVMLVSRQGLPVLPSIRPLCTGAAG